MRTERPSALGGRYRLESLLAQGGMADVYRATDVQLDRPVAVKVLRDLSHTDRFAEEAMTLARLNHPGLVTVHDAGVSDGCSWLVMDLVDGVPLSTMTGSALPYDRVAEIGRQLADALACVHAHGVVHRDVKPANVLLRADGRVVLTDFGIARLVEHLEGRTEAGTTMGTAAYLSPEQVRGDHPTTAVDAYSLGLVLLELLTGRRAYPGTTVESAVARLHAPPDVPPHLPAPWRDLLTSMTASEPSARPSMDVVATRLVELAGAPPPVRGATRVLPTVPVDALPTRHVPLPVASPRRRVVPRPSELPESWRIPALVVGGLLLVAVLFAIGASQHRSAQPARQDRSSVPSGVPQDLRAPLQDLHEAVGGR